VTDNETRTQTRLSRATFRAWRRGFREADLIMGPFAEQVGASLSLDELDQFERLLDADDHSAYAWATAAEPVPVEHQGSLMERLQTFVRDHVAQAVRDGAG
jgi:Uncharacterized conserved protein